MNYTFHLTVSGGKEYTFESLYPVLDFKDTRRLDLNMMNYPPYLLTNLLVNDSLHYTFFEQLTRQVSLKLSQVLQKDFAHLTLLACADSFFVHLNGELFLYLDLLTQLDDIGFPLWVKCSAGGLIDDMSKEHTVLFELCNRKETSKCNEIRFFTSIGYQFWEDTFKKVLKEQSQNCSSEQEEKAFCEDYPDVIVGYSVKKKEKAESSDALYRCVAEFVSLWNAEESNSDKIHDFFLLDDAPDNEVNVFVDFGNCDPIALQNLLEHVAECGFNMEKISLR